MNRDGSGRQTLYVHEAAFAATEPDGLGRVLEQWQAFGSAIGLLYGPRECRFVKVANAALLGPPGRRAMDPAPYEARIFNETGELRWWNVPEGGSRAVLLVKKALPEVGTGTERSFYGKLTQKYLLWGRAVGESVESGWSHLREPRIGGLDVPVDLAAGQSVQLLVEEYLEEQRFGNVVVSEEILIGFAPVAGSRSAGAASKEAVHG